MRQGISFDDVMIKPRYSTIESRRDIDISSCLFSDIKLELPIVSASMDTITEEEMIKAMTRNGGSGVYHRFGRPKKRIAALNRLGLPRNWPYPVGMAIGLDYKHNLPYADYLVLDVAHADTKAVVDFVYDFKLNNDIPLVVGNIATYEAAIRLINAGANALKVGVGPGQVCATRQRTGCGVPQLTAIRDVTHAARKYSVTVCADGGIRSSGDIVKALVAGADTVMVGSLLAGTKETPGLIEKDPKTGELFKEYRGQASFKAKLDAGMDTRYVEGMSLKVPYQGPVKRVLNQLRDGIQSGFSYVGARNIQELRKRAEFIRTSPTTRNKGN